MCGIAGVIWRDALRPSAEREVTAMADILYHRGPDDGDVYLDGAVALAHRRLSIIDLSAAGRQPMASHDGSLVIVYNGEIYNYLELRAELRQTGRTFLTNTDTEVILEAYNQWGADCVNRFNGMWAFALFDRRRREVLLSRDRFGIKPLYYVCDARRLAFASEIKGLLAAFPELRRVNLPMVHYFLPSGALDDGPETFFTDILSLPPAHNVVLRLHDNTLRQWRYWDLDVDAFRSRWGSEDPVSMLRELLTSSVDMHMRSDVPVGTCLSGGIDSSALVCLMTAQRRGPPHTFSGLYPDRECNEEEWVAAVLAHSGAVGAAIRPEPADNLVDDLNCITWHQDEPTAGPGLYTQFHVMRRAAQDVKVILDGQGGDELFAGYLPYLPLRVRDLSAAGGRGARFDAYRLAAAIVWHWGRGALGGAIRLPLHQAVRQGMAALHGRSAPVLTTPVEPPFFHPSLSKRVAGQEIERQHPARFPDSLSNTLYWHLVQQSIPALLHYEDRNSMAYSIEARVPYLDYRIVEFALALDPGYKIRNSWTKWVLREAAAPVMPKTVTWRRSKLGYPTPFARWLREEPHRQHFRDLIFSRSFIDRELMTKDSLDFYWNQHQSGGADRSWLLYRLATIELWHRQFIDDWAPSPAVSAPIAALRGQRMRSEGTSAFASEKMSTSDLR
jgi:asparagine synthase (glutamine-hydrolysing)